MYANLAAALLILLVPAAPSRADATYAGKPTDQWMSELEEALAAETALADDAPELEREKERLHRVQWYAVYALGQIGENAAAAVELLAATLADKPRYEYVRAGAAWALGRIGPRAAEAVPALVEALDSTLPSIRRNAVRALGQIGPGAASAVPALVELLESEDAPLRAGAAVALWRVAEHPRAIPALIETLQQEQGPNAFYAAMALGEIGPDADAATAALIAAFGHPDADLRRAAARSFARVVPEYRKAIELLRKPLAGGSPQVRRTAVTALGWFGLVARQDLLEVIQKAQDPAVRAAAQAALRRIRHVGQGLP